VDLAGGHGLLAQALLLLDDSSPSALVVDPALPPSASRLHASLVAAWPRLRDRVGFVAADLETVRLEAADLVVSCHACGGLTDRVLDVAVRAGARMAVLPCCHDAAAAPPLLDGWMDPALAVDVDRAQRLERARYAVWTQMIPPDITPKNRLLLGRPLTRSARRPAAVLPRPRRAASASNSRGPAIRARPPFERRHRCGAWRGCGEEGERRSLAGGGAAGLVALTPHDRQSAGMSDMRSGRAPPRWTWRPSLSGRDSHRRRRRPARGIESTPAGPNRHPPASLIVVRAAIELRDARTMRAQPCPA
jgi:hypothetical protein